ncbi:MAG TPA: hypothetical protein VHU22_24995 [Xanthobacteraceae bacterium]|jgi:hypothetical protein|nr:hypothetical protein [Xanthobacteraceae bacterium]
MRKLFSTLLALIGVAALMPEVGPHDAAANVCSWVSFWGACLQSLPLSFDKWAWLFPAVLFATAFSVLIWTPAFHLFKKWSDRHGLIELREAAGLLYGELRGTDLGRFTEGLTESESEILDNVGMQILHNAPVYVRRSPSPKWEPFPRSELSKMGVCNGATGIRYWGRDQVFYTDPKVSRRELRRVSKHLRQNANFAGEWSKARRALEQASPLEIIFDPSNPNRRFWSVETAKDEKGKPLGAYWEYRALIRNNSHKTLRNVKVIIEAIGPMPSRPEPSYFDMNKQQLIDLHPQDEALAVIRRWFNPPIVVGMASGADIYGPIKMTVSATDITPAEKLFHFDPERTPMIYE